MDHNTIRDSTVKNKDNHIINSNNTNTINITATTVAFNASNNAHGARDNASVYSQDFKVVVKLPFRRNPNFCGRQDVVEKLRQIFEPQDLAQHPPNTPENSSGRKTVVLCGMGGAGKSQIALEYAHRFAHCYTSILWIDSDAKDLTRTTESACKFIEQLVAHYVSRSESDTDYQTISKILGIPGKIDSSGKIIQMATELAVGTVHTWLAAEENRGWLLLVDNHDKAEVEGLEELIPTCDWGSVLVTTRCPSLNIFGELVDVEEIGAEAGLELLLKSSVKIKYEKPLNDTELGKAKEIFKALGELPLALDQAGAYIRFRQIQFSTYFDRLEKGIEASFMRKVQGFGLPPDKASVLTTWKLSFEELREDAQRLLCLCAFLSNEDIHEELFRRGINAADWLKDMEGHRLENAIGGVFDFALAKRKNSSNGSFWIHPLVHTWTRERMDSTTQLQSAKDAILLVTFAIDVNFHDKSPDDWIFKRHIFSHLSVCQENISKYFKESYDEKVFSAAESISGTYSKLGYYKQAEALYKVVLVGCEKTLGKDHPSTLRTVKNIASVFNNLGRYDEALEYYQRALAGFEKSLGKDYP
ncbi:hypothetical protein RUND412_005683 [Rhizina undulata]